MSYPYNCGETAEIRRGQCRIPTVNRGRETPEIRTRQCRIPTVNRGRDTAEIRTQQCRIPTVNRGRDTALPSPLYYSDAAGNDIIELISPIAIKARTS